jgi:hypothetical protein
MLVDRELDINIEESVEAKRNWTIRASVKNRESG